MEDEIKLSLQKEKDLNEMKSNFVAIASHEFRTPLSTILSSVSLIEKYTTTETQDKRARHVDRIRTAVTEMTAILEEFLSLEKIEQGKIQFKKESLNIIDIIRDTTITFGGLLKAGQEIEHFHSGKAEVYTDGGVMKHILNNLISNAIKYSGQQSKIVVESCIDENTLTLNVKDSGIGISQDDQRNLFERFFRASNVSTIRGTGLGLHIVKRYVDAMNGTIDMESEIGKGSVFSVTIPY